MGCDIHFHAEQLKPYSSNDTAYWQPVSWPERECWHCKGTGINAPLTRADERARDWNAEYAGKPCSTCCTTPETYDSYALQRHACAPGRIRESWYDGRNYDTFAILADVRNGYGFAGCVTGAGFTPIAMPRGLPDDVTDEVKRESDDFGIDGHSHSWLSLDEVFAFDWDRTTMKYGVVRADEYRVFRERGRPEGWSGDISGGVVRHVVNEEMDRIIANPPNDGLTYVTRVEWKIAYRDHAEAFLSAMEELRAATAPHPCRIVFWFDN